MPLLKVHEVGGQEPQDEGTAGLGVAGRDLLTACISAPDRPSEGLSARVAAVEDEAWSGLLRQAAFHNVIPLMNKRIGGLEAVPEEVRRGLRVDAKEVAESSLRLTSTLLQLTAAFATAQITAIAFKGPALAADVYGDVGLRHSLDLDFIVSRRQASAAKELLESLGFRGGPEVGPTLQAWIKHGRSVTMQHSDGTTVDLQWAADLGEQHDLATLFSHIRSLELGGAEILVPSCEDLLLLLSVHGAKHLWSHLYWIADIVALLTVQTSLDWNHLQRESRREAIRRRLLLALALADQVEPLELLHVPEPVIATVRNDRDVTSLAGVIWDQLFRQHLPRFPFSLAHVRLRDSNMEGARYALRLAWTPTDEDWLWLQLPGHLWWVYPFLRPIRLGGKYVRQFLQRLMPTRPHG
jgi:hypothetical protein